MVEPTGLLLDLHHFFGGWSFWVCFTLHCTLAATFAPDLKDKYLLHYWATFLAGFGGGCLSSLMLMRPDIAPLPLLGDNLEGVIWTITWWIVNYSPFNVVERIVKFRPVLTVASMGSSFCRAGLMAARVDLAVKLFPNMLIPPVLLGTVGGFAGKVFLDIVRGAMGLQPGLSSHEMINPGFIWRSALLGSMGYYGAVHIWELASPAEGLALLRAVLIGHSMLSQIFGMPLDFTKPMAAIGHTCSNVPRPNFILANAPSTSNSKKNQ
ncbi:hypothetical protein BSKO_13561 [Bryopsis sp. KO-2023]|nr:hypothetical protein BSKO_13561 [Bryopsis sp. KO-2023]